MEREKEGNKARFLRLIVESHGSTILDGDSAPFYGFYPAQLQRLISLVEQETLERAAKKCEEVAESWIDESNKDIALPLIWECAFEIRNLKDNHDKE